MAKSYYVIVDRGNEKDSEIYEYTEDYLAFEHAAELGIKHGKQIKHLEKEDQYGYSEGIVYLIDLTNG